MEFSREQEKKAFDSLSKEVRDYLFSDEYVEALSSIGKKHGLLLDKVDALERELLWVVYGLKQASSFPRSIQNALGTTEQAGEELAKDVSDAIFSNIRQTLKSGEEETVSEAHSDISDRDALLAEIESPRQTTQPVSSERQENVAARDFIANRLTDNVTSTIQRASTPPASQPVQKPKSYAVDPYREPIA